MPWAHKAGVPSEIAAGCNLTGPTMPIVWKELYVIVCAVHSWGHLWTKQKILFHCDNAAVVDIWCKGSTRDPETMALVHMLYLRAACHNINIIITHISGVNNCIADSLSRFQVNRFRALAPTVIRTRITSLHGQPHPLLNPPSTYSSQRSPIN